MIEALCGLLGAVAGVGGAWLVSRRKPGKPIPGKSWINWDFMRDEIKEMSGMDDHALLAKTVDAGHKARQLLADLAPSLQHEFWLSLREIGTLEVTDPRDRVIMRAGYVQALLALLDGLETKAAVGKTALQKIETRADDRIKEVSIA